MTEKDKLYRALRWALYLVMGYFAIVAILGIIYYLPF